MNTKRFLIKIDDIFAFLVFLLPLFRYYKVPGIGLSFQAFFAFILFFLGVYLCLCRRKRNKERQLLKSGRWLKAFIIWGIIVTLAYELFSEINLKSSYVNYSFYALLVALLMAVCLYFVVAGYLVSDNFLNMYSKFIAILVTIFVVQWVIWLMGIKVSFKLPFEYTSDWSFLTNKIFGMNSYPTSLFSERSHFCEYIVPYIGLCLFSENVVKNKRLLKAIICSVCVLLTASGNGIIIILIEWALWFLGLGPKKVKNISLIKRIVVVILGVFVLVATYLILIRIPRFEDMFANLFVNSSTSQHTAAKADYRIYRGFDIYFRLPLLAKVVGVGYKHMFVFSKVHHIVSIFDYSWHEVYEYFSAISMIMLYFGLIGVVLFMGHFVSLFKKSAPVVKGLLIIMLALFMSCEMLLNYSHLMYMLIIIAALQLENKMHYNYDEIAKEDVL